MNASLKGRWTSQGDFMSKILARIISITGLTALAVLFPVFEPFRIHLNNLCKYMQRLLTCEDLGLFTFAAVFMQFWDTKDVLGHNRKFPCFCRRPFGRWGSVEQFQRIQGHFNVFGTSFPSLLRLTSAVQTPTTRHWIRQTVKWFMLIALSATLFTFSLPFAFKLLSFIITQRPLVILRKLSLTTSDIWLQSTSKHLRQEQTRRRSSMGKKFDSRVYFP